LVKGKTMVCSWVKAGEGERPKAKKGRQTTTLFWGNKLGEKKEPPFSFFLGLGAEQLKTRWGKPRPPINKPKKRKRVGCRPAPKKKQWGERKWKKKKTK